MTAVSQLVEQIHGHLAEQPADKPSGLYTRLVNAERVVLSADPVIQCRNYQQYARRHLLEKEIAELHSSAVRACNKAYLTVSEDAGIQVNTSCSALVTPCDCD